MKTLLYLGSTVSEVSTYGTKLMKICCLIITVFLGLSACVDVPPPPPPPPINIKIASVSVDASRANWAYHRAYKSPYVSVSKLEKAVASAVQRRVSPLAAVQRRVSPLAQGSRAVAVTLTIERLTFNYQVPLAVAIVGYASGEGGPNGLHSRMWADLKITDAQSGETLYSYGEISTLEIIHEKKWPIPKDIQWSENEVNKNLGELAMYVADEVACSMFHAIC